VPLALTYCGLPAPVLAIVTVAARAPAAAGANAIEIVQVAPAATFAQVEEPGNSVALLLVTALTVAAVVPTFVTITLVGALAVPTACDPNATDACTLSCAQPVPVPLSDTDVDAPSAAATCSSAERAPGAEGRNVAANEHDALGRAGRCRCCCRWRSPPSCCS